MNLVFVFAAYMEYAVVTVVARKYKKKLQRNEKKEDEDLDRKVTPSWVHGFIQTCSIFIRVEYISRNRL